jgi:hypothetical protein
MLYVLLVTIFFAKLVMVILLPYFHCYRTDSSLQAYGGKDQQLLWLSDAHPSL